MNRRLAGAALLAVALTGCGGDNPPPPTTPPPSGDIPVTGHEQLGWSQNGASIDLESLRFSAYVDGARAELTAATCQPTGDGSADCRSPLPPMTPGRHVLELTATQRLGNQSAESPRSSPIVLIVGSGEVTSATAEHERPSARDENPPPPGASAACSLTAADDSIYVARSSGEISIHQLTTSPIHQLEWRAPRDEPVVLRSMAAHPDYARTHWMYLLLSTPANDRLVLARYREVEGVLGESAVLFDQAMSAPVSRPILRFGPDGRIYVFLLGSAGESDPAPRPFILRLNEDGSVPRDNPSGSPQLDLQARTPLAATWDADGRLWVIERDANGSRLRLATTDAGEHLAMADVVSTGFLSPNTRWFVGGDGRIGQMEAGGKLQVMRAGSAARRIADALATPDAIVACDALRPELDVYALRASRGPDR